jgi:hypothetical protein
MAVMSFEHLAPFPRRNHQYHRLYSPSQLERFHVLHVLDPIEQTPDSSANKFLPYDFHIFIEKEHLTRRWSIRFSATRSSSWDMKSWFLKTWYATSSEWVSRACVKGNTISFLTRHAPVTLDKGWIYNAARREVEARREVGMWPMFAHHTVLSKGQLLPRFRLNMGLICLPTLKRRF